MTLHLSVVVLTWNEEANVGDCLDSLAGQADRRFEVIVIDAASKDATADLVRGRQVGFPVPLRLVVAGSRIAIGAARRLGVRLARAPNVAFLSADAEADKQWTAQAVAGLEEYDMVFGRQLHAPRRWTVGAAVRGLRYHFPTGPAADPLRFASNVGAAYRRSLLLQHPYEPDVQAAEDLVVAARAAAGGLRATYAPAMMVYHHDVATWRVELRKNVREGAACGRHFHELGPDLPLLAWGAAVAIGATAAAVAGGVLGGIFLGLTAAALWAPALRRAWRRRRSMPAWPIALGVAASPAFDIVFLGSYVVGLLSRRRPQGPAHAQARP